ncbi:MAG: glycoside hydrolase family 9 protein [Ignavibacteriae bacterium]|nr:glycoside hydrolase family 9 protein [Ignavibacteriota bacterium]
MKKIYFMLFVSALLCKPLYSKSWIRINQLGYKPNSVKVAVLSSKVEIEFEKFEIIELLTEKVVYTGNKINNFDECAAFKKNYRLYFSDFKESGTFYIKVNEITSPNFVIGENIYNGSADFILKYMRQQRCGYNPFLKDSCHVHDGFIVDHPNLDSTHIDVIGGWHDASDYLQYVTTSANATYQMLFGYQQNPKVFKDEFDKNGNPGKNGIPDILDEAKWGLDWLDKMNPEYGIMYNQIADDRDHRKFTLPTLDSVSYGKNLERPVYFVTGKSQGLAKYKNRTTGVSSTAAKFASSFALGSDLLKKYYPKFSEKIKQKSIDAFEFAKTDLGVCQTACNVSPYFYEEDNYVDDLELAAAQLSKTFSSNKYLDESNYWGEIEQFTPWMGADTARHYQWYPFVNLGHFLNAELQDSISKNKFINFLHKGIENIYQKGISNPYFFGVPFIWCSNNLVVAILTQINLYNKLTGDNSYEEMEASLRDWLFGCNPWGTSMIVGFPKYSDFPADPHSAFTAAFNYKIDGGLVDGPVYTSIFNRLRGLKLYAEDEYSEFQSDLAVYHDDYGDYSTNEPTMDGTASLSYYLSSMENLTDSKNQNYIYDNGGIIRGDTSNKIIHLVFTGGDYNDGGNFIADLLKRNTINAHFFFTGDFYRNPENENLIYKLKQNGNYLGAHSDKHLLYADWQNRDSLLITKDEFISDLKNNYAEMEKFGITKENAKLFLPPYEWYNSEISKWTNELGLTLINFTPGAYSNADYTTPNMNEKYFSSEQIFNKILDFENKSSNGLNGTILLFHVGTHPDRTDKFYFNLDELINKLKENGYSFRLIE